MKEYRLQREINKSVYYMLIKRLIDLIREKSISYLSTPVQEKFTYVLISLQNSLLRDKKPIFTELEVYKEKGELMTKLRVDII